VNTIRMVASTGSPLHRLLLTVAAAFLLITGLLAMHTLTAHDHDAEAMPGMSASAAHAMPAHDSMAAVTPVAAMDPIGTPASTMWMELCVLALLAASIILVAPLLGATRWITALLLPQHQPVPARAVLHPRPPSLAFLSISRI
jgi:cell division protein FtsW (lipid II flippase)